MANISFSTGEHKHCDQVMRFSRYTIINAAITAIYRCDVCGEEKEVTVVRKENASVSQ